MSLLVIVLLGYVVHKSHGFPTMLVETPSGCMLDLAEGEIMMNHAIVPHVDSTHADVQLVVMDLNQNPVHGKETDLPVTYTIKLQVPSSLKDVQYAVETSPGGRFPKNGGCEGQRRATSRTNGDVGIDLEIESLPLKVWAGWAQGHEAVQLTDVLEFVVAQQDDKPQVVNQAAIQKLAESQRNEILKGAQIQMEKENADKSHTDKQEEKDHHHFALVNDLESEESETRGVMHHNRKSRHEDRHVPPPRQHGPKKEYISHRHHFLHGYHSKEYTPKFEIMSFVHGTVVFIGGTVVCLFLITWHGRKHKGRRDL